MIWVAMLGGCGHPPLQVLVMRCDECLKNKQYDHALLFAEEAAQVAHEAPNVEQEGLCLERVGRCRWELKQYEKAVDAYDQAIAIWSKNPRMWIGMPRALNAKAGVLIDMKRYDDAEETLLKAIRYCFGEGNKEPIYREKMQDFRNIGYRIARLAHVASCKGEDPAKWYEYCIEEMNRILPSHPSMTFAVRAQTVHMLSMWKSGLGEKPDSERLKRYEKAVEEARRRKIDLNGEGSRFPHPDPLMVPEVRSNAGA